MTSQAIISQCPKCKTCFRASQDQLGAANGAVRCGLCLHVFWAAKHEVTNIKRIIDPSDASDNTQ